jgi:5'-3' exonuclease
MYDRQRFISDYGVLPENFRLVKALTGDSSDNIDGVKGVGEATLKKYVPEIADPTAEISVDMIRNKYANIKKVPKMIENILNNEDIIERNITLMNLHESIMSIDAKMKVVNRFQTTQTSLRKVDLTKLMMKSRLLQAFPNYDSWLSQNFIPLSRFNNDTTA